MGQPWHATASSHPMCPRRPHEPTRTKATLRPAGFSFADVATSQVFQPELSADPCIDVCDCTGKDQDPPAIVCPPTGDLQAVAQATAAFVACLLAEAGNPYARVGWAYASSRHAVTITLQFFWCKLQNVHDKERVWRLTMIVHLANRLHNLISNQASR